VLVHLFQEIKKKIMVYDGVFLWSTFTIIGFIYFFFSKLVLVHYEVKG